MSKDSTRHRDVHASSRFSIDLICEISRQQYGKVRGLLSNLFADVIGLYEGKWQAYGPCQVGYHNLVHALDVALAVARMTAGWNKAEQQARINEEIFLAGTAAALFHDTGYIKDKGDTVSRGGKYTFNHVERSIEIAAGYLQEKKWPASIAAPVSRMIRFTDFYGKRDMAGLSNVHQEEIMARMVATADLVAQMADVDYMNRIGELFEEFEEAYSHESRESLAEKGVQVYSSAREMAEGALSFYEDVVLPHLENLGRMDRYLAVYFADGRNPYQENIAANLSSDRLLFNHSQWQRLGDVLERLGIAGRAQVEQAVDLQLQNQGEGSDGAARGSLSMKNGRLMAWMNKRLPAYRLGEVLMDMKILDSQKLCHGLLTQVLPPELEKTLTRDDLLFLLRISVLLQSCCQGSQVFDNLLEMTNAYLGCEASCIRLVDWDTGEMFVAVPKAVAEGGAEKYYVDKGLAGWVYHHGQPVTINNVDQDGRFTCGPGGPDEPRFRSILAVPFHVNGEWVGAFELLNKKGGCFVEHDTELVICLINLIGAVLGNMLKPETTEAGRAAGSPAEN